MFKKISVYFLAICANFPCKTKKFEFEVVGVLILRTRFAFRAASNISYREIAVKLVPPYFFYL